MIVKDNNIFPLDVPVVTSDTGNVYKAVSIIGKRSNQIAKTLKNELTAKLSEFGSSQDGVEEYTENKEQIEIAKKYEQYAKPTQIALDEFLKGNVYFKDPEHSPEAF